jgi:putative ABC transport system substrate-binding protein
LVVSWLRGLSPRAREPVVPVVGVLGASSSSENAPFTAEFVRGLNEAGFVEGRNVAIEYRWAEGRYDRLPTLADELLRNPAESIKAGKAYYGEVPILGTPYITGYEPIKDSSGAEIGVYYVGYKK